MTYQLENETIGKIGEYMNAHHLYPEMDFEHNDIEGAIIVTCHISWGDWKHDHLAYSYLLQEWAKENGFTIIVADHETEIDEEDGSDTYSAYHRCSMYKSPMA